MVNRLYSYENIEIALKSIEENGLFLDWMQYFYSEKSLLLFSDLFNDKPKGGKNLGEYYFEIDIPFVIIYELFDELSLYFDITCRETLYYKESVAQAYFHKRFEKDKKVLLGIRTAKILYLSNKRKTLIQAHIDWILQIIDYFQAKSSALPQMEHTQCVIGKWLSDDALDNVEKDDMLTTLHSKIHNMAKSCIEVYQQNRYSYFGLLYSDLIYYSLEFQSFLTTLHYKEKLISMEIDPLTRLANYFMLQNDLAIEKSPYILLLLNIHEFSKFNITFGHSVGDKLIQEVAKRLQKNQHIEKAYRLYGDNFAIRLHQHITPSQIKTLIDDLEKKPFNIKQHTDVSLSFYASYGKEDKSILERNELAMIKLRREKQKLFNSDTLSLNLIHEYANNLAMAEKLHLAYMRDRVIPYFQPIYNLKTNQITKYEALMRIEDYNNTILEPNDFLNILQNMYIYSECSKIMIRKTFEVFDKQPYDFSINLSFRDIINPYMQEFIHEVLHKYPHLASRCTFELLEYEAVMNVEKVNHFFEALKKHGVKIALDDFGSGYSNYIGIFNFELDYLKIDGSIVQNILVDKKAKVIMESILFVAKELDVEVVAEYVSSEALYDEVKNLGVDFAQGYCISKAKSHQELFYN
ncbi:MAG: EAL domain-containing protein [Campylobacterales bacterium]|nr:EAL domain-containing protein [Campylobacterales bacterium]